MISVSWSKKRFLFASLLVIFFTVSGQASICVRGVQGDGVQSKSDHRTSSIALPAYQQYTRVKGRSGIPLVVRSENEYRQLVSENKVYPYHILFIERLPLDIDLPLVRGVVMGQPLSAEGTHIQVLSEKLQIPLATSPNVLKNKSINEMAQMRQPISVRTHGKDRDLIEVRLHDKVEVSKQNISNLPESGNRKVFEIGDESKTSRSRLVFGDKFVPLRDLAKNVAPRYLPTPFFSVSVGYSLRFLENYKTGTGERLNDFLKKKNKILEDSNDYDLIRETLEEIRQAIEMAQPVGLESPLRDLSLELKNRFGKRVKSFSLRSNNDVEDLLGAGLYKSVILKDLSIQEIERGYREILSSMYTFRAYVIRRERGLREDRLAMPLLIHPYVSGESFSATVRFRHHEGGIIGEFVLVRGNQSKATNPGMNSTVIEVILQRSAIGRFDVLHQEGAASEGLIRRLRVAFDLLVPNLEISFFDRVYPPIHVDVEFVIVGRGMFRRPVFLQYKNTISHEVLVDVLRGTVGREEVEALVSSRGNQNLQALPKLLKIMNLSLVPNLKETSYDDFQRFLLYRNRENEIFHIFWKDGREHEKVHEVLNQARLGLKVIGGGYWVIAPSEGRVLIENSGLRQFQMNPDSSKTHKQVRAGLLNVFAQDSYWKSDFDLYQIGRSAAFPDSIRTLMTRDEFENP
ncbi:MAG: hypothetical protein KDD61_11150 [Bdellovibrionales bacterium]|nr:hypothetical protein [Bdellovibrionales bacterium]